MRTVLRLAVLAGAAALALAAAPDRKEAWRVFCTPELSDCPEYPFDATVDKAGNVYLAASTDDDVGSGLFVLAAKGGWSKALDGTITSVFLNPVSNSAVAGGFSLTGPSLFTRPEGAAEFSPVKGTIGLGFSKPDCSDADCIATASVLKPQLRESFHNAHAGSCNSPDLACWQVELDKILPGRAPFRRATHSYPDNFAAQSHWPYGPAEAAADAAAGCLRVSRSRCLTVSARVASAAELLLRTNGQWVVPEGAPANSTAKISRYEAWYDSYAVIFEDTPAMPHTTVPEGYSLNDIACRDDEPTCVAVGETNDGTGRAVWVFSANSDEEWTVMTSAGDSGAGAPFLLSLTAVRYSRVLRGFVAIGEVKGSASINGSAHRRVGADRREQALLFSLTGAMWRRVELPAGAEVPELLVSLDLAVHGAEEIVTVVGRNARGGAVFGAWTFAREISV